jgi:flagellar hook-associated protein 1 FlgK
LSTFSGLNTALSSLYAQRRGMDITGQNIANANTEGYTRQRVNLAAVGGTTAPSLYGNSTDSGGVTVTDVGRLRDAYLENRGRVEHASNEYLSGQAKVYDAVQAAFGEPGENGLQAQLSKFWSSWHDLSNNPGDPAARTAVIAQGQTVSTSLNRAVENFSSLYSSTREQMNASVEDINSSATQIAQLNQAIMRAGQSGLPTNELADQRDTLVMHLSEVSGATAVTRDNGTMDVYVGGSPLVNNLAVRKLEVSGSTTLAGQSSQPVVVNWADTTGPASISSGSMASALETLNSTLPRYMTAVDGVAANLAQTVNDQHAQGFDLQGNPGGDFFTGNNGNPVTAGTITVGITDTSLLAASAVGGTANRNGDNSDLMAGIANLAGGPDSVYRQVVVDLGTAAKTVQQRASVQTTITTDSDAARQSEAGVNLDEEMTNLISYQRAYQAASKVINSIDATLDSLMTLGS